MTPLAAGSASDVALRILADKLSERFAVPVIVQNQPGAGGVTAGRMVTTAPPNGYTIAWAGNNSAIGVSLFREAPDPRHEMKPIVGVSRVRLPVRRCRRVAEQVAAAVDRRRAREARRDERRHV